MKIIKSHLFVLLLAIILLISCHNKKVPQLIKFKGEALGTFYSVSYYDTENRNLQNGIDSLFGVFIKSLSTYDSSSIISHVNQNKSVVLDDWFKEVFRTSEQIYTKTDGCFDPTVAPLVNAWGFGFTNAESMNKFRVDSILEFVGFSKIRMEDNKIIKEDARIMLDFNAIAKGYCSDVAALFLESKGITSYLVEIGGEIASKGKKPDDSLWKIGVEKPAQSAQDEQSVFLTIEISDRALATSGNYRKYFEKDGKRYAHTIDPKTGYPTENNLLSATVIADRCITADAYATAFMVMGVDKAFAFAEQNTEVEAFFIFSDDNKNLQTKATKGFELLIEK